MLKIGFTDISYQTYQVSFLANIVSRDCQSVTNKNIELVKNAAGCSPWDFSTWRIKAGLKVLPIPEIYEWRMSLLSKVLEYRMQEEKLMNNTDD